MKKKLGLLALIFTAALLFASCDEVLSVVTVGENGEKVVNNYVSMFGNKVYDETVSIKKWRDIDIFDNLDVDMDNLLFKIENKKENIVVFGDKEAAMEISFFDGGYKYTLYTSMEKLSDSMNNMFKY